MDTQSEVPPDRTNQSEDIPDSGSSQSGNLSENQDQSEDVMAGILEQTPIVPKEIYEGVVSRMKGRTVKREEEEKEQITLSIWDFAGHELYYTTHQVRFRQNYCYYISYTSNSVQ